MHKPTDAEQRALHQTTIHYREVLTFLEAWYKSELDRLPYSAANHQVAMGRCQVLAELTKHLNALREQQNQSR